MLDTTLNSTTFAGVVPELYGCVGGCEYHEPASPAGNLTLTAKNDVVYVDTSAQRTMTLPASPYAGMTFTIKDNVGTANANPIEVDGNGNNIEGSSSVFISEPWGWKRVQYDGSQWILLDGSSVPSLAPYIVGETNSNFSEIQAAMDAANALSPTETSQINVYVKPKSSAYVEDLTFYPWVNLIAFPSQINTTNQPTFTENSVIVTGSHTAPVGINSPCNVEGITFIVDNTEFLTYDDSGTINFTNSRVRLQNAASMFAISGAYLAYCNLYQTHVQDKIGNCALFFDANLDASFNSLIVEMDNSQVATLAASTTSKGNVICQGQYNRVYSCPMTTTGTSVLQEAFANSSVTGNKTSATYNGSFVRSSINGTYDITAIDSAFSFILCDLSGATFSDQQPTLTGFGSPHIQSIATGVTGTYNVGP